jgi:hypothetical protein
MMTRRLSTPMPESPVRFYRIIAVSFLVITVSLLSVVLYMTTKRATITVVAKEDTAHFELSAALQETAAPGVVQGSVAVVQFPFSKTYTPVGSKFTEGTAKGTVTVFNKSSQAVALIPKTRFQTGSGTLFRLLKRADIPAGGQATVDVYADAPGKDGDIGPSDFILPALSADQQKVIFAKSDKPMIGGSTAIGVVTTDDIAAAQNDFSQKAQAEFVARGLGVNLPEDLKTLASVADTKTVVDKAVGSEASQFTVSGTSTIVIINYHVSDVKRLIQSEINRKTAASAIKILSLNQEVPTVMVASFDLAAKTAQLTLSQDALVTVDSANDALDPMRFTNKTREQIQSQINSLEYVAGSEVTFSPQFLMRTSPNLSDKIKVVVKNIK